MMMRRISLDEQNDTDTVVFPSLQSGLNQMFKGNDMPDNHEESKIIVLEESITDNSKDGEKGDEVSQSINSDFKKMSVASLKEIAIQKGLISESDKSKKTELIKLLSSL